MTFAQRRVVLGIAILLCMFSTGHGQASEPEASAPITVRVFDYAGLDADALAAASEQAAALFRRVSVSTVWEQCRTNLHPEARPCTLALDPAVLAVRILPTAIPPFDREARHIFGFAFPPRANGFANVAAVFWDRVNELAESKKVSPATLLAAVTAHEAGHLLLGPNSHFPIGLMKALWDDAEIRMLSQSSLGFSERQGKDCREAIAARIAASRPVPPPMTLASGKWPWVGI